MSLATRLWARARALSSRAGQGADQAVSLDIAAVGPSDVRRLARFFARNGDAATRDAFDPFELTADRACAIAERIGQDGYYARRRR